MKTSFWSSLMVGLLSAGIAGAQLPLPIPVPIPGLPPQIPQIPGLPQPGGTPGIPNIPGMPNAGNLFSPTGALLMPFMRKEAGRIFDKLKTSLPQADRSKVDGVPLLSDDSKDSKEEVNAFAGCDDNGKLYVVVTDGMYQIVDLMSQAKAVDEQFGTNYYNDYIKELAKQQAGKARVLPMPTGWLDATKSLNPQKLKRQMQIFQEVMGYILGHELAHHYRGHLGSVCTGSGGGTILKPGDLIRAARKIVPAINQINEVDSDRGGINNMLDAGQNEVDYKWGEGGALLIIDFFKQIRDTAGPQSVLFTFMSTHPAPEIRGPIVKQVANMWRLTHPGAVTGK